MSTQGAPIKRKDTARTLRKIICYKHDCIRQDTRRPVSPQTQLLQKGSPRTCCYKTSFKLENCVQKLNSVTTGVTVALDADFIMVGNVAQYRWTLLFLTQTVAI